MLTLADYMDAEDLEDLSAIEVSGRYCPATKLWTVCVRYGGMTFVGSGDTLSAAISTSACATAGGDHAHN